MSAIALPAPLNIRRDYPHPSEGRCYRLMWPDGAGGWREATEAEEEEQAIRESYAAGLRSYTSEDHARFLQSAGYQSGLG